MKEVSVAPRNQHIGYLVHLFWYYINPPSNRCSSRDFEERCFLRFFEWLPFRFPFSLACAHHHQLTYKPILHHHDRLTNRFQVIKGHFSGELRRCYRAPVGFVFLWPFTALAGQWRRQTDSPAQCAVVIGFMGPCGDRRQQFLAPEGTVVPSRRGDRRHCWPVKFLHPVVLAT